MIVSPWINLGIMGNPSLKQSQRILSITEANWQRCQREYSPRALQSAHHAISIVPPLVKQASLGPSLGNGLNLTV